MWNVGIRMADVTAEVKLELEVLQSERPVLFTMRVLALLPGPIRGATRKIICTLPAPTQTLEILNRMVIMLAWSFGDTCLVFDFAVLVLSASHCCYKGSDHAVDLGQRVQPIRTHNDH